MTYPKQRAFSGLRVILHLSLGGHRNAPGGCHHWFLTFDGSKCSNPHNIEQLDYSAKTGDYQRAMDRESDQIKLENLHFHVLSHKNKLLRFKIFNEGLILEYITDAQ